MEKTVITFRVTKKRKKGMKQRAKKQEKTLTEYIKFLDNMYKNRHFNIPLI